MLVSGAALRIGQRIATLPSRASTGHDRHQFFRFSDSAERSGVKCAAAFRT
jgi:hypothetical protein